MPTDQDDEDEGETQESDFYCVVCDKYYKSQQQFASHESSKKHLKLAEALKQEMMQDEETFDFGKNATTSDQEQEPIFTRPKRKDKKNKKKRTPRWGFEVEDEDEQVDEDLSFLAAALELEQSRRRKKADPINDAELQQSEASTRVDTANEEMPANKTKKEKRKEKKKAKEETVSGHNCNVCGNNFPTRNQLFNHIKETGHALAVPSKQAKNKRR